MITTDDFSRARARVTIAVLLVLLLACNVLLGVTVYELDKVNDRQNNRYNLLLGWVEDLDSLTQKQNDTILISGEKIIQTEDTFEDLDHRINELEARLNENQ